MDRQKSAFAPMPKERVITPEGYPFIALGALLALLAIFIGWILIAVPLIFMTIFVCFFFRNPKREASPESDVIVAPADGRILAVEDAGDSTKISTFMSILNCHVNRVPVNGRVENVAYRPGSFFVASLDKASEQNEQNAVSMKDEAGREIRIVQIAGLVARRIVCYLRKGVEAGKGSRLGLIRFGSRVDLFLPKGSARIEVKKGDRVRAGSSIIGRWQ